VVERLATRLGAGMTAPLARVPARVALSRVATASLAALRLHARAVAASSAVGDQSVPLALLDQAVALDSGFVDAWRRIAIANAASGGPSARSRDAVERAWHARALVSEGERLRR
jgi:hypothetical protein